MVVILLVAVTGSVVLTPSVDLTSSVDFGDQVARGSNGVVLSFRLLNFVIGVVVVVVTVVPRMLPLLSNFTCDTAKRGRHTLGIRF